MGHYLVSGRSSSWERAAGLAAGLQFFSRGLKRWDFIFCYVKDREKNSGVTPEMVSVLVQQ